MKVHRINLAHAQYVVAQLLEAVIDAAEPKLKLAKLEGDAAFFFAEVSESVSLQAYVDRIGDIVFAFRERRAELDIDRLCTCDGCVQASQLRIKFVAHEGEVAYQKIKRHVELAGMDVIVVHRLLKNEVPLEEYVLYTDSIAGRVDVALQSKARPIEHDLEGIGRTSGHYVEVEALAPTRERARSSSGVRRFRAWLKMTWRALPYMLGLRTPCAGFGNLGTIGELPPALRPGAPAALPGASRVAPPNESAG